VQKKGGGEEGADRERGEARTACPAETRNGRCEIRRLTLFLPWALPLTTASNGSFLLRDVAVHPVARPDIAHGPAPMDHGKMMAVGTKISAPIAA
jgi:hypothetical protein